MPNATSPPTPPSVPARALLATAAAVVVLALWWLRGGDHLVVQTRQALTPQECITECQSRQTDCIQACEGVVPCEAECVVRAEGCVKLCREGPPVKDAGPG